MGQCPYRIEYVKREENPSLSGMQLPCEMTRRFLYQNIKSVFLWPVTLQIIFYCIYTCTFPPHFLQLAYKNFKNNKHFKATWLHSLIVFNILLYHSTGHKWKKKRAIKTSLTEQCFVGNHTKPEWNITSHNSVCFNQIIPAGLLGGNTQFVHSLSSVYILKIPPNRLWFPANQLLWNSESESTPRPFSLKFQFSIY